MKRTHSGLLYVIALSIPLLFSFNNCGKSNLKSSDVASLDASSTGDAQPVATSTPIATTSPTPTSVGLALIAGNPDWPTDNNCMNNNNYDTCLIWKSPIAHRYYKSGSATASIFYSSTGIAQNLKRGTDLSAITTLAVNMGKYSGANGLLKNSFIDVYASNTATTSSSYLRAAPVSGKYKQVYATDTNYNFAQYMAFYWINYARDFFEKRGAIYHSAMFMSGKPAIPVDAFNATDSTLVNNGYFTWNSKNPYGLVALGSVRSDKPTYAVVDHEVALSAEAYVHEMGHANLFYASGGPTNSSYGYDDNLLKVSNTTNTASLYLCSTSSGCRSAIDEGQADFHSHILFERQPYLLEMFKNSATGDKYRNATFINSYTSGQSWYDYTSISMNSTTYKGEIHYMGGLYASMLYNIYTDPNTDKNKFVKVFSASLKMVDRTSTFPKMKQALIDADNAIAGTSLANIIAAEFSRRGY